MEWCCSSSAQRRDSQEFNFNANRTLNPNALGNGLFDDMEVQRSEVEVQGHGLVYVEDANGGVLVKPCLDSNQMQTTDLKGSFDAFWDRCPTDLEGPLKALLQQNAPAKSIEVLSAILDLGDEQGRDDGILRARVNRRPGGRVVLAALGVVTEGHITNEEHCNALEAVIKILESPTQTNLPSVFNDLPTFPSLSSYAHKPAFTEYSGHKNEDHKLDSHERHDLPFAPIGQEADSEHVLIDTNSDEVWHLYEHAKVAYQQVIKKKGTISKLSVTDEKQDEADEDNLFIDQDFLANDDDALFINGHSAIGRNFIHT